MTGDNDGIFRFRTRRRRCRKNALVPPFFFAGVALSLFFLCAFPTAKCFSTSISSSSSSVVGGNPLLKLSFVSSNDDNILRMSMKTKMFANHKGGRSSKPSHVRCQTTRQYAIGKKTNNDDNDSKKKNNVNKMMGIFKKSPGAAILAPFVLLFGLDIVANVAVVTKRSLEVFFTGEYTVWTPWQ